MENGEVGEGGGGASNTFILTRVTIKDCLLARSYNTAPSLAATLKVENVPNDRI